MLEAELSFTKLQFLRFSVALLTPYLSVSDRLFNDTFMYNELAHLLKNTLWLFSKSAAIIAVVFINLQIQLQIGQIWLTQIGKQN